MLKTTPLYPPASGGESPVKRGSSERAKRGKRRGRRQLRSQRPMNPRKSGLRNGQLQFGLPALFCIEQRLVFNTKARQSCFYLRKSAKSASPSIFRVEVRNS